MNNKKLYDDLHVDSLFASTNKLNDMDKMDKMIKRSVGVIFAIWVAWILFCIAVLCGVVYVAWHFISKYW